MKKKLTANEKITIAISFIALITSFAGIYFSHFYESHGLEAVVMEADPAGGDLIYSVAVINPGNRKAIITEAWLGLNTGDSVLYADNPLESVKLKPRLPMIIDEKSIVLLTFSGPLSFQRLYARGQDPDKGSGLEEFDGERTRKITINAGFKSMDFKGKAYQADAGVLTVHITTKAVAGWGHEGAKRSLFE